MPIYPAVLREEDTCKSLHLLSYPSIVWVGEGCTGRESELVTRCRAVCSGACHARRVGPASVACQDVPADIQPHRPKDFNRLTWTRARRVKSLVQMTIFEFALRTFLAKIGWTSGRKRIICQ